MNVKLFNKLVFKHLQWHKVDVKMRFISIYKIIQLIYESYAK